MIKKINIQIDGIHCASCKKIIEAELSDLDGIINSNVNEKTGNSTVEYDEEKITRDSIVNAIKKLKYGVQETSEDNVLNNNGNYKVIGLLAVATIILIVGGVLYTVLGSDSPKKNKTAVKDATAKTKTVAKPALINDGFLGDKGAKVIASGNKINIAEAEVSDGNLHAYNYYSEKSGKNIYFFIVKASDGAYRAAANGCEVCHGAKKGFSQQGDQIQCDNCRIKYSKDKIAMEKGGCNPGPISPNVTVDGGNLSIDVSDVEAVGYLF